MKTPDDKFISRTNDNEMFSLNEVFLGLGNEINYESICDIDGPPIRKRIHAVASDEKDHLLVRYNKCKGVIRKITFVVDLSIVRRKVPISRVSEYNNDDKTISQVIEYDVAQIGNAQVLQIIKDADGKIRMSTRKK
jgi:hypothetical protein